MNDRAPTSSEIIASFSNTESRSIHELASMHNTTVPTMRIELARIARIESMGNGRYRLAPILPVYMSKELDVRRMYASVADRVAEAMAIPSKGGD